MLICSFNEEQSILDRTIVGAQAMDYPNLCVWMLDDSSRDWLKDLCARLGRRYVSRPETPVGRRVKVEGERAIGETVRLPRAAT